MTPWFRLHLAPDGAQGDRFPGRHGHGALDQGADRGWQAPRPGLLGRSKEGDGIVLKLPPERVAWILARACGHAGSCAEYLYNTVSHLEALGIRDRNLWRLQKLVAEEIVRIHKSSTAGA